MSFTFCCCLRFREFFNNLIHCNRASRRAWADLLKIKTKHTQSHTRAYTHAQNKHADGGLRVWKIREANIFAQTLIGNCQHRRKDMNTCVVDRLSLTHTHTLGYTRISIQTQSCLQCKVVMHNRWRTENSLKTDSV